MKDEKPKQKAIGVGVRVSGIIIAVYLLKKNVNKLLFCFLF